MKQSRLTTDARWGNWRHDFNHVVDLPLVSWDGLNNLHSFVASEDNRQFRHCPVQIHFRLQYPGGVASTETVRRLAGRAPKRFVRTVGRRKEYNRRWAENYNRISGVGGEIEMPGMIRSLHPSRNTDVMQRTGVVEERDNRSSVGRHRYGALEQAGIPQFCPPPRMWPPSELGSENQISHSNGLSRSDSEQVERPKRRSIYIELNFDQNDAQCSEIVDMPVSLPEPNPTVYDCNMRMIGTGAEKYSIHDLERKHNMHIREETKRYSAFVQSKRIQQTRFGRSYPLGKSNGGDIWRLPTSCAGLQEINLRRRSHLIGRVESVRHVSPAIAPQIIDIARRGVIQEYRGSFPPEDRIAHYPYVQSDTEKMVKASERRALWNNGYRRNRCC